jgi:uncharacterized protein YcaQ
MALVYICIVFHDELAVNDNLPVHEDKSRGVYVKGMKEVYVGSKYEVYEVMKVGDQARKVSATSMLSPFDVVVYRRRYERAKFA